MWMIKVSHYSKNFFCANCICPSRTCAIHFNPYTYMAFFRRRKILLNNKGQCFNQEHRFEFNLARLRAIKVWLLERVNQKTKNIFWCLVRLNPTTVNYWVSSTLHITKLYLWNFLSAFATFYIDLEVDNTIVWTRDFSIFHKL